MTFEPRHENKSCSACRERVNERVRECERVREGASSMTPKLTGEGEDEDEAVKKITL